MNKNIKIAVFENEWNLVVDDFSIANYANFSNKLQYKVFKSSQELGDLNKIKDYDLCFVDISLAPQSEKDGYAIIQDLGRIYDINKIVVLTGNSRIYKRMKELGIPKISILKKPIDVADLSKNIRDKLKFIK